MIRFDHEANHRHSRRLRGYDYTQGGAYFVTIVTQGRAPQFGDVVQGTMQPNDAGRMVQEVWEKFRSFHPGAQTDAFVIMPNHFHCIIVLVGASLRGCPGLDPCDPPGSPPALLLHPTPDQRLALQYQETGKELGSERGQAQWPAPTGMVGLSLGDVVQRFKTMTTKLYADGVRQLGWPTFQGRLWQRNYYEHIIRNEGAFERVRRYIDDNPERWDQDEENPLRATF